MRNHEYDRLKLSEEALAMELGSGRNCVLSFLGKLMAQRKWQTMVLVFHLAIHTSTPQLHEATVIKMPMNFPFAFKKVELFHFLIWFLLYAKC